MSELKIVPTGYLDPVARTLVSAAMADLSDRYGGTGDDTPVDPAQFDPPRGAFLVAWLDGEPVACGGWRTFHLDGDAAEIKRMFTLASARRRGVAMAVLRAVEESAKAAGRTRAILETGGLQPEAIALYERAGYRLIDNFGYYKDEPDVRSYGRDL
ncbi:GNAT family N-acetyltransferase [Rugosimonospora africana]|uniref:N-acetyltransferase n=1 Tax=Rugosimonospora africana TaxID=556532 RepID=A0A8J3QM53_9ACTN|nr:GNAT family N-acetyltransferase [Rugosimonospora africana]GIH13575.1 N-acetyltransferase [Rugosimonospora africana]